MVKAVGSQESIHIYSDPTFVQLSGGSMNKLHKPGDEVPASGVYRVTHNPQHEKAHKVTCIKGTAFPPCRDCEHPRFVLVYAAHHIANHKHFRTW